MRINFFRVKVYYGLAAGVILQILNLAGYSQDNEVLKFTLPEAQEYAIQNGKARKNAALDVEIANKKVWETTAMGLPQVSGGIDFQFRLDEIPQLPFGPPDPNDPQQKPTMIQIGEKVNATYKISASQLIFSGPYIVGLQASKAYKSLSEIALQKTERDLKANVASTYYTVLLLSETNAILDSSVINLGLTLTETQAMQRAGFIEEVVADQVKVSLSMVESSAMEMKQQLQSAKNFLKLQMGIDNGVSIELTESLDALMATFAPEAHLGGQLDPNQNVDLRIMANQINLNNLQLKLEKSNFLPNLAAFVMYQKLAKEPEINFTPNAIMGITLSLPIFSSGMRRSKVQQVQLQLEKSKNSYDLARQSLEMELADATAQLCTAWSKYIVQKENRDLAMRVYRNYRVKYSKGMASQQDLIQANDKYLQAVGNYIGTVVELFNARLRVDKVIGKI
jgi:outer membrane protein TolC